MNRAGRPLPLSLLIFFLVFSHPVFSQIDRFGERIREVGSEATGWASRTATDLWKGLSPKTCRKCGQPTPLGRDECLKCTGEDTARNLTNLLNDALGRAREGLKNLGDPKLTDTVVESLLKMKECLQRDRQNDPDMEREVRRQGIESIGDVPVGPDRRPLNDFAREAVWKYMPSLEGTDYGNDPAKTLSYFLVLDGKGFIENVKIIRGPLGLPMTLKEGFDYYYRVDPGKSQDILEIMDDIRKLSNPSTPVEKLPHILDGIARGLRLLMK